MQGVLFQVCTLSSTLFHTFSCHSEAAHLSWRVTDHFGILFALFGTYISLISNTFLCFPPWREIHLSAVMVLFSWVIFEKCRKRARIPLDIFISVALYSAIPIAHWAWLQGGLMQPVVLAKLRTILSPFIAGGVGLIFYVSRFPEKLFKAGSVDIWGASHQVSIKLIYLGCF